MSFRRSLTLALPLLCGTLISGESRAQNPPPVLGAYECWYFSSPRMGLNFTLQAGGAYLDADNGKGTYAFDAATKELVFKGAGHDGEKTLYEVRKGTPTVSFQRRGSEVAFCEGPRK